MIMIIALASSQSSLGALLWWAIQHRTTRSFFPLFPTLFFLSSSLLTTIYDKRERGDKEKKGLDLLCFLKWDAVRSTTHYLTALLCVGRVHPSRFSLQVTFSLLFIVYNLMQEPTHLTFIVNSIIC